MWVNPALFWEMRYVNAPRCLPGEKQSLETRRLMVREKNVDSTAAAVKFRRDYKKQHALQVVWLKNKSVGNELCVYYEMKYLSE